MLLHRNQYHHLLSQLYKHHCVLYDFERNGLMMYLVVTLQLIDYCHQILYKIENLAANDNYFDEIEYKPLIVSY